MTKNDSEAYVRSVISQIIIACDNELVDAEGKKFKHDNISLKGTYIFSQLKIIISMYVLIGRRSGLIVSAFVPGASGPGSSPGRGHCVVFLGKTLHSHGASLHPGV